MSSMGHRHLINQSQMSELDSGQSWNHPCPDPHPNLENGSFVHSSENVAVNGLNSVAYFNTTLRSNGPPLSTFTSEIPNYMAIGTSNDLYLRTPSAASSSQPPPSYVQHGPPFFDQRATGDAGSIVNPQMDYGRASHKRKIPELSIVSDRGNTSRYYSSGSASNLPISNEQVQRKPLSGPHCWPCNPVSVVPSYGSSNVFSSGEGSQRNVRTRHNHGFHVETVPFGVHASNNVPEHFHSAADTPGLSVVGQWSQNSVSMDPQRMVLSSDVGSFNHEINQSLAGSSVTNNSKEIDGGYHSNFIASGSSSTTLPSLQGPPTRGPGLARSNHGPRTYRAIASYPSVGFAVNSEDGGRPGMETVMPPRQPRPLTTIGCNGERNGRARNFYDRFQSFSDEDNNRSRWISEGVAIMDRSTFYDSRNFFDQHHDMRLDVDNMSYEELLSLGERIGIVSTGLSQDAISRCLMESLYCSSKQNEDDEEELKCPICLEEYGNKESLGRLNCGHDFHAGCIKQWLLIKNVCPICKASALEDTLKDK
ncbi:probable E3 ubiquitin-protein ligase HIP1 isoform X1 [Phoenix dactylifera]|uniref:RING-type E3 ubiquitin transferase n=1 Tax=Phoenix dactylifera TaxID=42345 RepID=A0A8B7CRP8_PHODC|nr:probable E3 ubiquitin-protein ligase HIP1 isoform X1 [Phoenix dactylifera]